MLRLQWMLPTITQCKRNNSEASAHIDDRIRLKKASNQCENVQPTREPCQLKNSRPFADRSFEWRGNKDFDDIWNVLMRWNDVRICDDKMARSTNRDKTARLSLLHRIQKGWGTYGITVQNILTGRCWIWNHLSYFCQPLCWGIKPYNPWCTESLIIYI